MRECSLIGTETFLLFSDEVVPEHVVSNGNISSAQPSVPNTEDVSHTDMSQLFHEPSFVENTDVDNAHEVSSPADIPEQSNKRRLVHTVNKTFTAHCIIHGYLIKVLTDHQAIIYLLVVKILQDVLLVGS